MIENALSGIVLTAQTFNPSIFTESWLTQNGIVAADELVGMRVFSPEVAQFQTSGVQVLVIPPKMQISFSIHEATGDFELPRSIATRTVELLPETPYQALGLNFDYFVAPPGGQDFNSYTRALLGSGDSALIGEFASPDAKFGRYFSRDHGDARLKLDIKPVKAGPENRDLLRFGFNFHHDVRQIEAPQRADTLTRLVGTWDALREYAEKVVGLATRS